MGYGYDPCVDMETETPNVNRLLKITQLVRSRARGQTKGILLQSPGYSLLNNASYYVHKKLITEENFDILRQWNSTLANLSRKSPNFLEGF
jgi:hypothetical protein